MKRLSDLVNELNNRIAEEGDLMLHQYTISDENFVDNWGVLSKTRVNKEGKRLIMTNKEFSEYVKEMNNNYKGMIHPWTPTTDILMIGSPNASVVREQ